MLLDRILGLDERSPGLGSFSPGSVFSPVRRLLLGQLSYTAGHEIMHWRRVLARLTAILAIFRQINTANRVIYVFC